MKLSFRLWKQLEDRMQEELDKYPQEMSQTDKINSYLSKALGVSQKPLQSTLKPETTTQKPYVCVRNLPQDPNPDMQKVKCDQCRISHFSQWKACQELRNGK